METIAIRARIRGRVQGVSFRYCTQKAAKDLRLVGWVRNLPDGSVEAWAQGPTSAVHDFQAWLHKGPPLARVDAVQVESTACESPAPTGFEIRL